MEVATIILLGINLIGAGVCFGKLWQKVSDNGDRITRLENSLNGRQRD